MMISETGVIYIVTLRYTDSDMCDEEIGYFTIKLMAERYADDILSALASDPESRKRVNHVHVSNPLPLNQRFVPIRMELLWPLADTPPSKSDRLISKAALESLFKPDPATDEP